MTGASVLALPIRVRPGFPLLQDKAQSLSAVRRVYEMRIMTHLGIQDPAAKADNIVNPCDVKIALANPEPSTHGTFAKFPTGTETVCLLGWIRNCSATVRMARMTRCGH
jgi:hypothetical protein